MLLHMYHKSNLHCCREGVAVRDHQHAGLVHDPGPNVSSVFVVRFVRSVPSFVFNGSFSGEGAGQLHGTNGANICICKHLAIAAMLVGRQF